MNDKTDWWALPMMIILSPIYLLVWIGLGLLALILLGIGIIIAGWKQINA
jgi:hypothetical protein